MTREDAKREVKSRISCRDFLKKSPNGNYCCPFCGSGTGPNKSGALEFYEKTNTVYCFACKCRKDVIDLYGEVNGTDFKESLSLLADSIGITIDSYSPTGENPCQPAGNLRSASAQLDEKDVTDVQKMSQEGTQKRSADYSDYYKKYRTNIDDPAADQYLQSRGISPETAKAYWLGFDPKADPAQSGHYAPRIIIPCSKWHYVARSIDPSTPIGFKKMNPKDSEISIFNERALFAQDVQEIFVVEGAFDALSVIEAGATAIALNSTSNAEKLIELLEEKRTAATLILCLDHDKAGQNAEVTLKAGLRKLNISFITADICKGCKDPNEALTNNREAFIEAVERARRQAADKPDNTSYYIDNLMAGEIQAFKSDKKTGFANLDAQAGGLYSGLYVLAAISSLGKTSFALQMADQLAAAGNEVLFFSMEQSRLELVSKSIARVTAQIDIESAVTSLSIRKGYLPKQVMEAAEEYKTTVSDRISIVEGNFACNISFIGDYIRQYIKKNGGTRPVVIIDYLQILQPAEENKRLSTKEAIDNSVTALKRISRELDLTLIVISSVNRANYLTPIDFESLKESGGIEFTADVIWGLQLQCLNDPIFDKIQNIKERRERIKAAKAANPRKIELCCLKNRYGIANYSCYFNYYPANDLFTECSSNELDIAQEPRKAGRRL